MGYKSRKAGVLKNVTETFTAIFVIPPIGAAAKTVYSMFIITMLWKDREGTHSFTYCFMSFLSPSVIS